MKVNKELDMIYFDPIKKYKEVHGLDTEMSINDQLIRQYDSWQAPPLSRWFRPEDYAFIQRIAIDPHYTTHPKEKYQLLDEFMLSRGFKTEIGGTNRRFYSSLEYPQFGTKISTSIEGFKNNIDEFNVQHVVKPYCTKKYDISRYPDGTPNGIITLDEVGIRIGKEDLGDFYEQLFDILEIVFRRRRIAMTDIGIATPKQWVIRPGFGPILCDFPSMVVLDPKKCYCTKPILVNGRKVPCNGVIDFDIGFNKLECKSCGQKYEIKALASETSILTMSNAAYLRSDDRKGEITMSKIEVFKRNAEGKVTGKTTYDSNATSFVDASNASARKNRNFNQQKKNRNSNPLTSTNVNVDVQRPSASTIITFADTMKKRTEAIASIPGGALNSNNKKTVSWSDADYYDPNRVYDKYEEDEIIQSGIYDNGIMDPIDPEVIAMGICNHKPGQNGKGTLELKRRKDGSTYYQCIRCGVKKECDPPTVTPDPDPDPTPDPIVPDPIPSGASANSEYVSRTEFDKTVSILLSRIDNIDKAISAIVDKVTSKATVGDISKAADVLRSNVKDIVRTSIVEAFNNLSSSVDEQIGEYRKIVDDRFAAVEVDFKTLTDKCDEFVTKVDYDESMEDINANFKFLKEMIEEDDQYEDEDDAEVDADEAEEEDTVEEETTTEPEPQEVLYQIPDTVNEDKEERRKKYETKNHKDDYYDESEPIQHTTNYTNG